jgi:hypothetical protein
MLEIAAQREAANEQAEKTNEETNEETTNDWVSLRTVSYSHYT